MLRLAQVQAIGGSHLGQGARPPAAGPILAGGLIQNQVVAPRPLGMVSYLLPAILTGRCQGANSGVAGGVSGCAGVCEGIRAQRSSSAKGRGGTDPATLLPLSAP
jgi:hypothetical protein